ACDRNLLANLSSATSVANLHQVGDPGRIDPGRGTTELDESTPPHPEEPAVSSCEDIAAAWLSGTEFAGNRTAVQLLSRAISPGDFAVERESLPVSAAADPVTSATILELLERGQVPTMAAIRTLTAQNE